MSILWHRNGQGDLKVVKNSHAMVKIPKCRQTHTSPHMCADICTYTINNSVWKPTKLNKNLIGVKEINLLPVQEFQDY